MEKISTNNIEKENNDKYILLQKNSPDKIICCHSSIKEHMIKNLNWKVIESYFQGQHLERLVRHQIESYNNFINYQIKKTIEMFNPVTIHSDHDRDEKSGLYSLDMIITFNI